MKEYKVVRKQTIISYAYVKADSWEDAEAIAKYGFHDFEICHEVEEYDAEVSNDLIN